MEDFYEDEDYAASDTISNIVSVSTESDDISSLITDDSDVIQLLDHIRDYPNQFPLEQSLSKGEKTLTILSQVLLGDAARDALSPSFPSLRLRYSTKDLVTIGIIPSGFYALGLWDPDDTISVCAAGTPSAETFFDLACTRFLAHKDLITIEGFNKLETSFDLVISSVRVQIAYHSNPLISKWSTLTKNDVNELTEKLSGMSAERLTELVMISKIEKRISHFDFDLVRKAYWAYLTWSKNLGLSPVILRKEHILTLTIWGMSKAFRTNDPCDLDLPIPDTVEDINKIRRKIGLDEREFKEWRLYVVSNVTGCPNHRNRFIREEYVSRNYSIPQWPVFFIAWDYYYQISINYWGSSSLGAARWFSSIKKVIHRVTQSRRVGMLTRYQMWPCPFQERKDRPWFDVKEGTIPLSKLPKQTALDIAANVVDDAPEFGSQPDQTHFEVSYFVGWFGHHSSLFNNMNRFSEEMTKGFEEALAGENRQNGSFNITRLEAKNIQPVWYPYTLNLVPVPADLRELNIKEEEDEDEPTSAIPAKKKQSKTKFKGKGKIKVEDNDDDDFVPPGKEQIGVYLRPAGDVLNRIKHDPEFNTHYYRIGYMDRFKGIKEMPFYEWTTERTSQEFIPLSRIRYFKKVMCDETEGEVVWDREAKIDLIFKTGIDTSRKMTLRSAIGKKK